MKLLKRSILASTMSILTLSSFGQLISFAEGPGREEPVYAIKGENVHFDSLELSKIKNVLGTNNNDIETLKAAKNIVSALGIKTFAELIQIDDYDIKIDFGTMKSVIDEVNPDLNITNWDCTNNTVKITNNTDNNINAHIGIEFDENCGIKDIELANADQLSNVAIGNHDATENLELTLSGGQINGNLNVDVFQKFYNENGEIKIGTAKVFITDAQVAKSIKAAANNLKNYAESTEKLAGQLSDANDETKTAAQDLVEAANSLADARKDAKHEYKNNVDEFVQNLKNRKGRLNGLTPNLGYNGSLSESVQKFIDANDKLTEAVSDAKAGENAQHEQTNDENNNNTTPEVTKSNQVNNTTPGSGNTGGKVGRKASLEERQNSLSKAKK